VIINLATMTGADNETDIDRLVRISDHYPFVEWGILFSQTKAGQPRYPSKEWLYELARIKKDEPLLKTSAHLCGKWCRDFIAGGQLVMDELPHLLYSFDRIQLNFSSKPEIDLNALGRICRQIGAQFIIQIKGDRSIMIIRSLQSLRVDAVGLHDLSGGLGKLPGEWLSPLRPYCGYAGGLGPDNLNDEIHNIAKIVDSDMQYSIDGSNGGVVWVDMETKIRTDEQFDLDKVKECLDVVSEWVE